MNIIRTQCNGTVRTCNVYHNRCTQKKAEFCEQQNKTQHRKNEWRGWRVCNVYVRVRNA